jgi:formylglycine-generating enzyme required for sulfatase activity/uncharacterized caspase-like protein
VSASRRKALIALVFAYSIALCATAMETCAFAAGEKYALLIGVGKYPEGSGFSSLPYSDRDVEQLSSVLISAGYDRSLVRVLTLRRGAENPRLLPTLKNIRRELDAMTRDHKPEDSLLIALSGHGITRKIQTKDKNGDESAKTFAFFCPIDSDLQETQSLLSVDAVYAALERSTAGMKVMLVDACRNDPTEGRAGVIEFKPDPPPPSVAALFSCSNDEISWDAGDLGGGHGVFFHFVIEGMKGDADQKHGNRDGKVSLAELAAYTQEKVPEYVAVRLGRRQMPVLHGSTGRVVLVDASRVMAPTTLTTKAGLIRLVRIPAGSYLMGSPTNEAEDYKDQKPQHEVRISRGFYLGETEVTQAQYRAVIGKNPSAFCSDGMGKGFVANEDTSKFPVENVSWLDAITFCNELSRRDGLTPYFEIPEKGSEDERCRIRIPDPRRTGYRLPTEAEWEYACRAGSRTRYAFGDDPASLEEYGWYADVSGVSRWDATEFYASCKKDFGKQFKEALVQHRCRTHPTRSLRPNGFGLFDMHGNVAELCLDTVSVYRPGRVDDPLHIGTYNQPVVRGGSFTLPALENASAMRIAVSPTERSGIVGFRIARNSAD